MKDRFTKTCEIAQIIERLKKFDIRDPYRRLLIPGFKFARTRKDYVNSLDVERDCSFNDFFDMMANQALGRPNIQHVWFHVGPDNILRWESNPSNAFLAPWQEKMRSMILLRQLSRSVFTGINILNHLILGRWIISLFCMALRGRLNRYRSGASKDRTQHITQYS